MELLQPVGNEVECVGNCAAARNPAAREDRSTGAEGGALPHPCVEALRAASPGRPGRRDGLVEAGRGWVPGPGTWGRRQDPGAQSSGGVSPRPCPHLRTPKCPEPLQVGLQPVGQGGRRTLTKHSTSDRPCSPLSGAHVGPPSRVPCGRPHIADDQRDQGTGQAAAEGNASLQSALWTLLGALTLQSPGEPTRPRAPGLKWKLSPQEPGISLYLDLQSIWRRVKSTLVPSRKWRFT